MRVYYDETYRTLIACLKELRVGAEMTQGTLAERLGKPQSYVSKYEQCQRRLDILEVRQICLALDSTLPALVETFENRLMQET